MQQEELDKKERQMHRTTMICASLFAVLMLLSIATKTHTLWLLFSLTDCSIG